MARGCYLGTEDLTAQAHCLGHIRLGNDVVSLPIPSGHHTAWPVPALPHKSLSCSQGALGLPHAAPPKTAIPGERDGKKTPGPHFGCSHQPGSARGTTRGSPMAPLWHRGWGARAWDPQHQESSQVEGHPRAQGALLHGTTGSHPTEPPTRSCPRAPQALGTFGAPSGLPPGDCHCSSRRCPLPGTQRPALAARSWLALAESLLPGPTSTAFSLWGQWKLCPPSAPASPPQGHPRSQPEPCGAKVLLNLRSSAVRLSDSAGWELLLGGLWVLLSP